MKVLRTDIVCCVYCGPISETRTLVEKDGPTTVRTITVLFCEGCKIMRGINAKPPTALLESQDEEN
jgi:hypothetical protein